MSKKKSFKFHLFVMLFGFASLTLSLFAATSAHAGSLGQAVDNGTCINCHEDLYFLHDTGNWFCIRESPMPCVAFPRYLFPALRTRPSACQPLRSGNLSIGLWSSKSCHSLWL